MNRSSTPKGSGPVTRKPVHVPNRGVAEAPSAFIRDGNIPSSSGSTGGRAMANLPMFAPVTGPRLTPEEAPTAPGDWVPHRPDRPAKSLKGRAQHPFRLVTAYTPAGDQPAAIAELVAQAGAGDRDQVLLGVTGSGKTFTMA
jgi:excinuclease ABC subunit B